MPCVAEVVNRSLKADCTDFSNLSYNKTQTVSVVLLSHIITNLIAMTINVLESHDSTIALRSKGYFSLNDF